jgi:hypothetical protein
MGHIMSYRMKNLWNVLIGKTKETRQFIKCTYEYNVQMHIVTCLLKAGIAEPEETAVLREMSVNTFLRQRIHERNNRGTATRKITLTLIFKRNDAVDL